MLEITNYDYNLPAELIAQQPLAVRSDARLMVIDRQSQSWQHAHVRDLPALLHPGDCLVLNDSRVLMARLSGHRVLTGGRWQGLFLAEDTGCHWRVLSKTRGKLQPGELIQLEDRDSRPAISIRLLSQLGAGEWAVAPQCDEPTLAILERLGRVPLPPYIRGGQMIPDDQSAYQTVYAREPGSVAAPTAGLHLTLNLLDELGRTGIRHTRVLLHVGIGTFRPMNVTSLDQHRMHAEFGRIESPAVEALQQVRLSGGRRIAIGTTTVRVLESAADAQGSLTAWSGQTDLFIRPPYTFRAIDGLLTNFHLPRATLLVLVRTFGGDALIRAAYDEAIRERYRFYSYGDAMLIL